MTLFFKSHIHKMSSYLNNSKTTFLFTCFVFLSPSISGVNADYMSIGACNSEGSKCWIYGIFGIAAIILVMACFCVRMRGRDNETSNAVSSTVETRRIAHCRSRNRNTVQVDRRNENDVSTQTGHYVVDISSNNGNHSQTDGGVSQPPPPYSKDSTLPRYT